MKKSAVFLLVLNSSVAYAQGQAEGPAASSVMDKYAAMFSVFFMVFMVASFIIAFTKLLFEVWLKNKLIERGASEEFLKQFIQGGRSNVRQEALKWAIVLAGLGFGLLLTSLTGPPGIHSLAILSLSLALSFFIYYRLVNKDT